MIRRGDWLIKASSFDDQILILFWNDATMEQYTKMFYSENSAYQYIESLLENVNQNCKVNNG